MSHSLAIQCLDVFGCGTHVLVVDAGKHSREDWLLITYHFDGRLLSKQGNSMCGVTPVKPDMGLVAIGFG